MREREELNFQPDSEVLSSEIVKLKGRTSLREDKGIHSSNLSVESWLSMLFTYRNSVSVRGSNMKHKCEGVTDYNAAGGGCSGSALSENTSRRECKTEKVNFQFPF